MVQFGCLWLAMSVIQSVQPPKLVLAFYYPWYGNPQVSGRWIHWSGVDEAKRDIASSTHYPQLGPYDSHDPKLCERHARWAEECGVDGFIVSWWGQNDFSDEAMKPILAAAERHDRVVTIYYETVPERKVERAVDDLLYVLNTYGDHPAWLKVDGRPVAFIYGRTLGEIGLDRWGQVIERLGERYGREFLLIGDRISPEAARIFHGVHTYNPCGALQGKTVDQVREWAKATYAEWVRIAREADVISCITVIPGYDDTKIRRPGIKVERFDGELYQVQWEEAMAANPDWVLITSWNEWHEGSEIEPSAEYGERYLELTRRFGERFKR